MSRGVHIVTTGFVPRDAISQHVVLEQQLLRSLGYRSEIFVEPAMAHPSLRGLTRPVRSWQSIADDDDVAILHYSISSPAVDHVLDHAQRSALVYHNITPPSFLWEFAPLLASECAAGRRKLSELAARVVATAADSDYNAAELSELGFPTPVITGILREALPVDPDATRECRGDRRPQLLFVGRGAPNKAQHDLILAVGALRETNVEADLHLVGSWAGMERYRAYCEAMAHAADVSDLVHFHGSVDDAALARHYADADLFLCLSDHEGFCVPLVEAMRFGLPIVAYASTAVPWTVGRAALVLPEKQPSLVAEAVLAVLSEASIKASLASARKERLAFHDPLAVGGRITEFVSALW